MKNSIIIILFLFLVLVCFFTCKCSHLLNKKNDYVVKIEQKVDTVIIYDTITRYVPKYIVNKTIDTIYLPSSEKDGIAIPIEQRYYREEGVYDAWISGYKPTLDSIKTYPRIEYRTITNNVTKEVYKNTLDFYPYTGFRSFDGNIGQVVGLSIKMPKTLIISGEIGVMNNKIMYGVNVGLKIN